MRIIRLFRFCLLAGLLCTVADAQQDASAGPVTVVPPGNNSRPVSWERYKLSNEQLSFEFPKLPEVEQLYNDCEQVRGSIHRAYAEHVVYEFRYYTKSTAKAPPHCSRIVPFGDRTLENRLIELRKTDPVAETEFSLSLRKGKAFTWEAPYRIAKRWLIYDFSNDRWVEFAIDRRKNSVVDETKLLNSFKFLADDGIEIGEGSDVTLGDSEIDNKQPSLHAGNTSTNEPLVLISKPKARYTDQARNANTQGNVLLRVTLLSNGAVGPIEVLSTLPHGLTEQAVKAARRLVFLPKRANGVPVNVSVRFDYGFNIF